MFLEVLTRLNDSIISNVGWGFSVVALLSLIVCIFAMISKLGDVKIGGKNAEPMMSKFNWFAISLTTTLASGILFWGPAEPIYHISAPPTGLTGIEAFTPAAAKYAMETMYLHWTFIPYALYTLPTIVFAFIYYNSKGEFSISSQLAPVLGKRNSKRASSIIDAIVLFAMSAGMAGCMGQGILNLSGGLKSLLGIPSNPVTWFFIGIALMVTFVITAITGLKKGIRILADINVKGYIAIIVFFMLFGPIAYMLNLGTEAFGGFLSGMFEKALLTGASAGDHWPQWWTTFYWASWMSWAPVTAVFLGRIAYGRSIRETIGLNLFVNGFAGALWMTIIGGTSINFQMTGKVDLAGILAQEGPGIIPYAILENLPFSSISIPFFIFLIFITFVTAANSTTTAMSGISSHGISPDNPESSNVLKILWGVIITSVGYIMISLIGVDGVKVVANLGGVLALVIEIGALVSLVMIIMNIKKYNKVDHDIDQMENQGIEKI